MSGPIIERRHGIDIQRFALNETSVSQCQPVLVYWGETAVAPVRILGVIPHGQVFEITSADDSLSRGLHASSLIFESLD